MVSFGEDAAKSKATDEELNSRYAKGDIRIVTESAALLVGRPLRASIALDLRCPKGQGSSLSLLTMTLCGVLTR
jgi:hypothetical protein